MVISDVATYGVEATLSMAETVCGRARPGSIIVQQRDRELGDRQRLALGQELRSITRLHGQALSVNERVDLALLVGADALHLPETGPSPERVRGYLEARGRRLWLSAAHHGDSPLNTGVDAWVIAPVFAARKGRPALGKTALREFLATVGSERTVFGLGGVEPQNVRECVEVGARVAVIGAAYRDPDALLSALAIER
jgi:thiamine-phosphate pyrophosphorylase